MKYKSIIDQKNYYAENNVQRDEIQELSINELLGHYEIFNDYESFELQLNNIKDDDQMRLIYDYFRYNSNNILKIKIINKIFDINQVNSISSLSKLANSYSFNTEDIHLSHLPLAIKAILLYELTGKKDIVEYSFNDFEMFYYEKDIYLKFFEITVSFLKQMIINNKEQSLITFYAGLLSQYKTSKEVFEEFSQDNNHKGFLIKNEDFFTFEFMSELEEKIFNLLGYSISINKELPSLKLEHEILDIGNKIEAEIIFVNNTFYADISPKEQGFIESSKDYFIYNMSNLISKSLKVLNNPYTKLAIAGIALGSSLMHSTDAMAADHMNHGISEDQISQTLALTSKIYKMKVQNAGAFKVLNESDMSKLHHTSAWSEIDTQLEKLGIDINELSSKHFNKMSLSNRFEWAKTDDGYLFIGGGYKAKYMLKNNHYEMMLTDSGKSEIVSQDTFLNWSNKILTKLNEARSDGK